MPEQKALSDTCIIFQAGNITKHLIQQTSFDSLNLDSHLAVAVTSLPSSASKNDACLTCYHAKHSWEYLPLLKSLRNGNIGWNCLVHNQAEHLTALPRWKQTEKHREAASSVLWVTPWTLRGSLWGPWGAQGSTASNCAMEEPCWKKSARLQLPGQLSAGSTGCSES